MATNFIQRGDVLELDVAGATASGAGVQNVDLFGVALNATTGAGTVPCGVVGVYQLPKTNPLVIARGDRLFWDPSPGEVNKTAAGQLCVGVAAEAAGSTAPTVAVLLRPCPVQV